MKATRMNKLLNFLKVKASAQSKYYLLFGRISTPDGICTKLVVDLRLPEIGQACSNDNINSLFELKLLELTGSEDKSKSPSHLVATMLVSLFELEKLVKYAICCPYSREEMKSTLVANEFHEFDIEVLGNIPAVVNGSGAESLSGISNVRDEAELQILWNGKVMNLKEEIEPSIDDFNGKGVTTKGFITKYENFCEEQLYSEIEGEYNAAVAGIWIYIHDDTTLLNADKLLVKAKLPEFSRTVANCINQQGNGPNLPPYSYRIEQRSFAPWNRFGDLLTLFKNSYDGDNRGFSLSLNASSRVRRFAEVILTENKVVTKGSCNPSHGKTMFFIPPNKPKTGKDKGYANYSINDGLEIRIEASNPLVPGAPDIDWLSCLSFGVNSIEGELWLDISGNTQGKGFPAFELVLYDKNELGVFLQTVPAPSEGQLFWELISNQYDYSFFINLSIRLNEDGSFFGEVSDSSGDVSISEWNSLHLSKSPAGDCPSAPCTGEYD